jgi:hypothetical protein
MQWAVLFQADAGLYDVFGQTFAPGHNPWLVSDRALRHGYRTSGFALRDEYSGMTPHNQELSVRFGP